MKGVVGVEGVCCRQAGQAGRRGEGEILTVASPQALAEV